MEFLSHDVASKICQALAVGTGGLGRAVQVDPSKPTLKAPATKRLKLKHDRLLSSFAFNFDLRHYISAPRKCGGRALPPLQPVHVLAIFIAALCHDVDHPVGRCRLSL